MITKLCYLGAGDRRKGLLSVYDLIFCTFVGGCVRRIRGVRALDRCFVSENPGGGCNFWFDMIPLLFLIDPVY
jgi:hypothetical protein